MKGLSGTFYVFCIAFVASVGGFLFGYDMGIMPGAKLYLGEQFKLSEDVLGFVTASAVLGAAAGPFLSAWLCDRLGRRNTLIWASLLLAVGAIFTALPRDIVTFTVFRIVGGLGVGLCSIASPMLIAEVAPPARRGGLGFMYQMAIVAGFMISSLVAWLLARWLPEAVSWRWMFGSEIAAVLIFTGGLLLVPESPRWLATQGRDEQAAAVLERIGGPEHARRQIAEIRQSLREEVGSFRELFLPGLRMALLVGILLAIFNNYTGWSGVFYYLPEIFKRGGFPKTADAIFMYVLAYAFMGLMTLVACFVVDRIGRRPLWIYGSLVMVAANILAGLVFQLNITGFPVLVAICLMAVPHSFALGPLPWLMMSELYPTRNRARAVAITTTILWGAALLPVWAFPRLGAISDRCFGTVAGVFWLYAILSLLAFLFGWAMLPETKGRTLEQIAGAWKRTAGQ